MTDEHTAPATWRIDVTRLPDDVVELIDALGPGDDLVIIRDGDAIATMSSTCGVIDDDALDPGAPDRATEPPNMAYEDVTVVATAMKLSASARAALAAELGAGYIVLDLHKAPRTADVLLMPPTSPQLVGSLQSMFPKARVIVAEFEDPDLGVSYQGPIRRLLDAGAETYLAATTVPRLANQLDYTITRRAELTGSATPQLEIEPSAGSVHPPA